MNSNLAINLTWWVLCMIVFILGYLLGGKLMKNQLLSDPSSKSIIEMHRRRKFYNFKDNELSALYSILITTALVDSDLDQLLLDIHQEAIERNIDLANHELSYLILQIPTIQNTLKEGKIEQYKELINDTILSYEEIIKYKSENKNIDIKSFIDKYNIELSDEDTDTLEKYIKSKSCDFFRFGIRFNQRVLSYIDNIIKIEEKEKK